MMTFTPPWTHPLPVLWMRYYTQNSCLSFCLRSPSGEEAWSRLTEFGSFFIPYFSPVDPAGCFSVLRPRTSLCSYSPRSYLLVEVGFLQSRGSVLCGVTFPRITVQITQEYICYKICWNGEDISVVAASARCPFICPYTVDYMVNSAGNASEVAREL